MTLEPDDSGPAGVVPTPDEIAALLQVEHLLDQRAALLHDDETLLANFRRLNPAE